MNEPEPPRVEREAEDDHDLLTYGEAGARLQKEIANEMAKLEGLTGVAADAVRERVKALQEAAERNGHRPINDGTFERFFGFPSTRRPRR